MQAWQATVQDDRGNAVPNPVVTVYRADGTTIASIFNEVGDPLQNPLTGNLDGFVQFYAGAGGYKIDGGGDTWEFFVDEPFLSKASAEASVIPDPIEFINVAGREYRRDAIGDALETQGGARWSRVGVDYADITDFDRENDLDPTGTSTSGVLPFRRAVDWLVAKGGGELRIPAGVFKVADTASSWRTIIEISDQENIHVRGAGIGATRLEFGDGHNGQGILMRNSRQCSVAGITFYGNKENQTQGTHFVRMSNCEDIDIGFCHFIDAPSYSVTYNPGGVGFVAKNIYIHDIISEGSVADAIDGKNPASLNTNIKIENVTVLTFSTGGPLSDGNLDKAAIDVRGPAKITNCTVYNVSGENSGIRLRFGEAGDTHGEGGHKSIIDTFHVYGDGSTSVSDGNLSVGVSNSVRNAKISNGIVEGCRTGVNTNGPGCVVQAVTSIGAVQYGFRSVEATRSAQYTSYIGCQSIGAGVNGFLVQSPNNQLIGCTARQSGSHGFQIEGDRTMIIGCVAYGNIGAGIRTQASANRTFISGYSQEFNGSSERVSDGGSNTLVFGDLGGTIPAFVDNEFRMNGTRLIGERRPGWTPPSGSGSRDGYVSYTAPTAQASYDRAQMQEVMTSLQDVSRTVLSLVSDLHANSGSGQHALLGT